MSENDKHTEGPWEVWEGHTDIYASVKENMRASISGIKIAAGAEVGEGYVPDDECIANAHLIAAAPELLEACCKLLNCPHQEHFASRLNDDEMAAIELMKKAVAKAEGGAE